MTRRRSLQGATRASDEAASSLLPLLRERPAPETPRADPAPGTGVPAPKGDGVSLSAAPCSGKKGGHSYFPLPEAHNYR